MGGKPRTGGQEYRKRSWKIPGIDWAQMNEDSDYALLLRWKLLTAEDQGSLNYRQREHRWAVRGPMARHAVALVSRTERKPR